MAIEGAWSSARTGRLSQCLVLLFSLLVWSANAVAPAVTVISPTAAAAVAASSAGAAPLPPASYIPRRPKRFSQNAAKHLPDSIKEFKFNAPSAVPTHATAPASGDPTVEELTLSPLVLAVTVDGHVHALDRETGQWKWTLHDDGGAAVGGQPERAKRQGLGGNLVKTQGRRRPSQYRQSSSNGSTPETGLALHLDSDLDEEVYVIEPFSSGDIYVYVRDGPDQGDLQKLPLSMQELVGQSPFIISSRLFVGKKDTKFVGVDIRTGRLVGVFGADAMWCEWDEQREGRLDPELEDDISRRPQDLLYMTRTEYHLSVFDKASAELLQTLTYTTYSTSAAGSAVQEEWTQTPDSRYLQPMHDGSLLCFVAGVAGVSWSIDFEHPVVSVFDIAHPRANDEEDQPQPLLLEHPHPLLVQDLPLDFAQLQALPETTFIGRVGEDLFAMNRDNFPLVPFAPTVPTDETRDGLEGPDADTDEQNGSEPTTQCRGVECLLGRHRVQPPIVAGNTDAAIDGPSSPLLLDPPSSQTPPRTAPTSVKPNRSSPHFPDRSTVLASLAGPVRQISNGDAKPTFIVFLLAILGYLYVKKLWSTKSKHRSSEDTISTITSGRSKVSFSPTIVRAEAKLPARPPADDGTPLPALDTSATAPSTPPTPALTISSSSNGSPVRLRSGSLSSVASPSMTSLKELPPLPPTSEAQDAADGDGDSDDGKDAVGGPRRKSRRRRGKKQKKGLASTAAAAAATAGEPAGLGPPISLNGKVTGEDAEGSEQELARIALTEAELKEDLAEELAPRPSGPLLVGGLTVTETILGYGSHGTVVLRGEFQGRAVAVKRLLKDFVTIATHEVNLLQESDDHPHVIRYFCKEQRDTFLYIALELCPASLFDLIDQPSTFPTLTRDLDSKRALKQITSGIRHLHKLKIVHRDIKPQNILVSTSNHGKGVRMLISDFGLCKKLDVDESSFQQTVNHAAGSFGYRAPEVLRGQVDPNETGSPGTPSHSTNGVMPLSTSTSSGGAPTDPSMRLTRSIDIFSLGCIFYYVLTGGEHPFGGRYEREMNILQGRFSLERLDGLGEEAVEVQDLIARMVASDPRERPTAEAVLLHPFFWNAQKRLLFICDASDRFEIMERDPPADTLVTLESRALDIVGDDWQKAIDRSLLDNLGKYRKYDGKSVRDLLRVLRNKKHHYHDLPESTRRNLGDLPGGFLSYFTIRFPQLLLHVYSTVETHLRDEPMFASTFRIPDEEH